MRQQMDTVFLWSRCRWMNNTTMDNENRLGGSRLSASGLRRGILVELCFTKEILSPKFGLGQMEFIRTLTDLKRNENRCLRVCPCWISYSMQELRIRGMHDVLFHDVANDWALNLWLESDVYVTCTRTLCTSHSCTERHWFIISNGIFNILVDKFNWFTVNASWPIPVGSWELMWYRPNQGVVRTVTSFIDEVETWTDGFRLLPLLSLKAWNRTWLFGGISITNCKENNAACLSNDHPENRNHALGFHGSGFLKQSLTLSVITGAK
jgi:hypothetical protein